MFMALRETKCSILPFICGGQPASLGQRHADSPSTRTNFAPHSGQWVGNLYPVPSSAVFKPVGQSTGACADLQGSNARSVALAVSFPTIFGIISPPFSTHTISPSRISNWRIKSSLCKVARCTVVPDNCTGSKFATGVTTPVLPTWYVIAFSRVNCFSAGNLYAIAHRGDLAV